eukprot:1570760-Rhodomonas_salina.3
MGVQPAARAVCCTSVPEVISSQFSICEAPSIAVGSVLVVGGVPVQLSLLAGPLALRQQASGAGDGRAWVAISVPTACKRARIALYVQKLRGYGRGCCVLRPHPTPAVVGPLWDDRTQSRRCQWTFSVRVETATQRKERREGSLAGPMGHVA